MFANTTGELPLPDRRALLRFVRRGGAFVGTHSASDTLHSWHAYARLLGGEFARHGSVQPGRLVVAPRPHPVTRGLPRTFSLTDEFYEFTAPPPEGARVLLRLDPGSVSDELGSDVPLVWARRYRRGRVFYDALGHSPETWRDPHFRLMMKRGLGGHLDADVVVVGGGILGLATAREMLLRRPGAAVQVLEREPELAQHQTGHNSGVIHAGIYYAPGSLKARLCVEGARDLYAYCEEHGVPFEKRGKLIVARDESELSRLDELERRGRANEVPGLRRVDAEGLREIEPHARGIAALHSPETGVVDFAEVARAFAADFQAAGGGDQVSAHRRRRVAARCTARRARARFAVFCAGSAADTLAVEAGADPDPRIVPVPWRLPAACGRRRASSCAA